jgi:hypothetical protein
MTQMTEQDKIIIQAIMRDIEFDGTIEDFLAMSEKLNAEYEKQIEQDLFGN